MAGISFSVFKEKILDGSKHQTIRKPRKNPIKKGDTLHLWWKQRSPEREKLGEARCNGIINVTIYPRCVNNSTDQSITDPSTLDRFAIADGFDSWLHMVEWFSNTHGLPFSGVLIQWGALNDDREDCHECGGTGHHPESIHMPCSNCLGNCKQPD
jgi:hypothetical protein